MAGRGLPPVVRIALSSTPHATSPWTGQIVRNNSAAWNALLADPLVNIERDPRHQGRIRFVAIPVNLNEPEAGDVILQLIGRWPGNFPVDLVFRSNIIRGVQLQFTFANAVQLRRFLAGLFNRPDDYDSERYFGIQGLSAAQKGTVWESTDVRLAVGFGRFLGGCNHDKESGLMTRKICRQEIELARIPSGRNNCAFLTLKHFLPGRIAGTFESLRRVYEIGAYAKVSQEKMLEIYEAYKVAEDNPLEFINLRSQGHIEPSKVNYVFCSGSHYAPVTRNLTVFDEDSDKRRTNRGYMAFDFETRIIDPTIDPVTDKHTNPFLKDTICSVTYQPFKKTELLTKTFTSKPLGESSARQFLNFLRDEAGARRSYHINAFNGSRHVRRSALLGSCR